MSTRWEIREGDCVEQMAAMPAASVDAIAADPPYGIGFMGHEWDQPGEFGPVRANGAPSPYASGRGYPAAHIAGGLQHAIERQQRRGSHHAGSGFDRRASDNGAHAIGRYDFSPVANVRFQRWCEQWAIEAVRVLKPGGHMVAFGGSRTYHRLVSGIEDAGFEIRDTLAWIFGSGFPKSRDLGDGWGTALKPGHEPILLARRPCNGPAGSAFAANGTGGLHIDACRIPLSDSDRSVYERNHSGNRGHAGTRDVTQCGATALRAGGGEAAGARWPANVLLDPTAAALLDQQSGVLRSGANPTRRVSDKFRDVFGEFAGQESCERARSIDVGGASRFFYCAKTSRDERNAGVIEGLPRTRRPRKRGRQDTADRWRPRARNWHPTVKPIELMRWLIRLITPAGGVVLDPFAGSGTTGCAAVLEGFDFVGLERDHGYARLAQARISHWARITLGTATDAAAAAGRARADAAASGQLTLDTLLTGHPARCAP